MDTTHDLAVTREPVANLRTYHRNPRHGDVDVIRASLTVNGQYRPIVVNRGTHTGRGNEVLAGNHTLMAARDAGWADIAVCWIDVDNDQAARIVIADNRTADLGTYDTDILAELLGELPDLDGTGYTADDLTELLGAADGGPGGSAGEARRTLAERFGVPPFTILDARQGYWQDRKRAWIALGLRSEEGRKGAMLGGFANAAMVDDLYRGNTVTGDTTGWKSGTSIFDPVLAELLVRWYSAPGHLVLDPFAGGSVRGIVTATLGRAYIGVDLRAEQVATNAEQAATIVTGDVPAPRWVTGDARDIRALLPDTRADMMLTCPPYFDLEQYSDDPADLSRSADYATFLGDYRDCLAAASDRCAPDAFAAIVTGALRDKRGNVRDLPADTTRIMGELGWDLYQDAVLATTPASAGLRAGRQFAALRKLTRVHQMIGVYHRGNIERVRDWPPAEIGEDDAALGVADE